MATCRDIVSGALRKIGRLGAGREPRPADQADGMTALQGMYRQLINQGTFGRLSDVIPTGVTYQARENERIFRQVDATLTVSLPETVASYASPRHYDDEVETYENVQGNTRPPRDTAVVVVSDAFTGQTIEFIYDGSQRRWCQIDGLALDDEAPLSARDAEGLKAYLAAQIADEYGAALGPSATALAANFISSLTHRYSMARGSSTGVFC